MPAERLDCTTSAHVRQPHPGSHLLSLGDVEILPRRSRGGSQGTVQHPRPHDDIDMTTSAARNSQIEHDERYETLAISGEQPLSPDAIHIPRVSHIDGATHFETGIAYQDLLLPDDAIYEFELAADDPNWAFPSWNVVGRLQHERRAWEDAKRAYAQALAAAGDDTPGTTEVREALSLAEHRTPLPPRLALANEDDIETLDSIELEPLDDEPADAVEGDEVDRAFDELFS